MKSPVLLTKDDVIARLAVKKSEWYALRRKGIIPPPDGREGNADRWSSVTIDLVKKELDKIGKEQFNKNTMIDIFIELAMIKEKQILAQ